MWDRKKKDKEKAKERKKRSKFRTSNLGSYYKDRMMRAGKDKGSRR